MKVLHESDDRPIKLGHLTSTGCLCKSCASMIWLLPSGTPATSDAKCTHCRENVNGSLTFCQETWTNDPKYCLNWHLRCVQKGAPLYIFIREKAKEQPLLLQHIILESGKSREWA